MAVARDASRIPAPYQPPGSVVPEGLVGFYDAGPSHTDEAVAVRLLK
jgi:hypothetical protein